MGQIASGPIGNKNLIGGNAEMAVFAIGDRFSQKWISLRRSIAAKCSALAHLLRRAAKGGEQGRRKRFCDIAEIEINHRRIRMICFCMDAAFFSISANKEEGGWKKQDLSLTMQAFFEHSAMSRCFRQVIHAENLHLIYK